MWNFKIHTFTGPGTFVFHKFHLLLLTIIVDYLVVAGGGGGGDRGGGGGAGGLRYYLNTTNSPIPAFTASPINNFPSGTAITVTATSFPITVGGGGTISPPNGDGSNGKFQVFSTISSTGGGFGGGGGGNPTNGGPGGSGGGCR